MLIKYIKAGSLDELKANIKGNSDRYSEESPFIQSHFNTDNWLSEGKFNMPDDIKLINSIDNTHSDIQNTKILYSALKDLPFSVAIDERFWAYQAHVIFWDYMRTRFPVEKSKSLKDGPVGYLREHYFFMPNRDRALIRNGISRLWWYGHLTYDETRENPFELTEALLEKLDIAQQLLERSYSRNPVITKTVLSMLVEKKKSGEPFSHRSKFRPLASYLNQVGGVTILDALKDKDLQVIIESKLELLKDVVLTEEIEESAYP